jgi:hypothetical protein
MTDAPTLHIEIKRRDKLERFELPLTAALIGSASHCDVRLAPDEAAERQLTVEPRGTTLVLRALAPKPLCTYQGAPFGELTLEQTGAIEIGGLAITLAARTEPDHAKPARNAWLQGIRQLALVGVLIGAYYFLLHEPPQRRAFLQAAEAPSLFAEGKASCPQREPEMARAFGEEQRAAAEGKRERSPFNARDGVQAVPLYETAAACFKRAGDPELAGELSEAAAQLKRDMQDELHKRQVRLEFFLARAKYGEAQREVKRLRAMLAGEQDPYGQWLSRVERELVTMLDKKQPKKGS